MLIPSLLINPPYPVHLLRRKLEVKEIIILRDVIRIPRTRDRNIPVLQMPAQDEQAVKSSRKTRSTVRLNF